MMKTQLLIQNLSKALGDKNLYKNVSFTFETGCYAILGPNGIGKTILLEILAGITHQDQGTIMMSNGSINTSLKYKKHLAYIPCKPSFFPMATGSEFLSFILSIKNPTISTFDQLHETITQFKLTNHLAMKFDSMSLGTQRKLFLATLVIGDNQLIILDEPTNGLDKESYGLLINMLVHLSKHAIIILTTHDPLLLKALNPTIIHLQECPTTCFS